MTLGERITHTRSIGASANQAAASVGPGSTSTCVAPLHEGVQEVAEASNDENFPSRRPDRPDAIGMRLDRGRSSCDDHRALIGGRKQAAFDPQIQIPRQDNPG